MSEPDPSALLARPRMIPVAGVCVRLVGKRAVYVHVAGGRYWTWGGRGEWTDMSVRLPFLNVGTFRWCPKTIRVRCTFMGWRGVDHGPSPALCEWRFPKQAGRSSLAGEQS